MDVREDPDLWYRGDCGEGLVDRSPTGQHRRHQSDGRKVMKAIPKNAVRRKLLPDVKTVVSVESMRAVGIAMLMSSLESRSEKVVQVRGRQWVNGLVETESSFRKWN